MYVPAGDGPSGEGRDVSVGLVRNGGLERAVRERVGPGLLAALRGAEPVEDALARVRKCVGVVVLVEVGMCSSSIFDLLS